MGVKEQLVKLKENWIIVVLVIVLFVFMSGGNPFGTLGGGQMMRDASYPSYGGAEQKVYASSSESYYQPVPPQEKDFAPDVTERLIVKTTNLATEVQRGKFQEAETELKSIVKISGAYLLNENVHKYGTDRKSYYVGTYQLKVDATKHDDMVAQLKGIGEVQSFNENQEDITGRYTNMQIEIESEKARLERYNNMYDEAKEVSDKLTLTDRIFDQERRIKYMEEALKNMDQRIEYSTVYFTMTEKRSEYAYIELVKLSELVAGLVGSFNALLSFLFVALPWLVVGLIIWVVKRKFWR